MEKNRTRHPKPKTTKRRPRRPAKDSAALRQRQELLAAARLAAMECETMAEAAVRCGMPDLAELLGRDAAAAEAWARGRLLRDLRRFAAAGVTMAEAGAAMAMAPQALEKLLASDDEAREVWARARLDTVIAVKESLVAQAREGKSAAIRQIEQVLLAEIESGKPNFRRLSLEEMVELTGKTRQTLHDWTRKQSPPCPRNADRTFDLREFLAWFEGFVARKLAGGKLQLSSGSRLDPLKAVKAERLEMDLAARRGELLEREAVMAGILARQQLITQSLARLPEEVATLLVSQPLESIRRTLRDAVAEARRTMCDVPPQLQLAPELAARFAELLAALSPQTPAAEGDRGHGKTETRQLMVDDAQPAG